MTLFTPLILNGIILFGSPFSEVLRGDFDEWYVDDGSRVDVVESIHLAPVTLDELTEGRRSIPVEYDGTRLSPPPVATTIVREVPDVWILTLRSGESPVHVEQRYGIRSECGESGCLSTSDSDIPLRVRIRETESFVTERNEELEVLQGGCILELDIGSIRVAGTYRGKLHVDISPE